MRSFAPHHPQVEHVSSSRFRSADHLHQGPAGP